MAEGEWVGRRMRPAAGLNGLVRIVRRVVTALGTTRFRSGTCIFQIAVLLDGPLIISATALTSRRGLAVTLRQVRLGDGRLGYAGWHNRHDFCLDGSGPVSATREAPPAAHSPRAPAIKLASPRSTVFPVLMGSYRMKGQIIFRLRPEYTDSVPLETTRYNLRYRHSPQHKYNQFIFPMLARLPKNNVRPAGYGSMNPAGKQISGCNCRNPLRTNDIQHIRGVGFSTCRPPKQTVTPGEDGSMRFSAFPIVWLLLISGCQGDPYVDLSTTTGAKAADVVGQPPAGRTRPSKSVDYQFLKGNPSVIELQADGTFTATKVPARGWRRRERRFLQRADQWLGDVENRRDRIDRQRRPAPQEALGELI